MAVTINYVNRVLCTYTMEKIFAFYSLKMGGFLLKIDWDF